MSVFFSPSRFIGGTSLGTLYVRLTIDPADLIGGLAAGENHLTRFSGAAVAALAAVGAASVYEFARFDEALTRSLSLMDDVSQGMKEKMGAAALELSTKTKQSATELADSFYYLASAGYTAEQSIGLLPVTTNFATAASIEAGKAVDYLATSHIALGLRVQDTEQNMENMLRVSDVLTRANQLSIATIEDYSKALSGSAGTMKVFGIEVEEGVAVLSAFAAQGIKGAQAGTAFAIVVRDIQRAALQQPEIWHQLGIEVHDASGNFRNMADVLGDMEKAFAGASDEQKRQAFLMMGLQDRSLRYTLALMGTSDMIREYQKELENAAGATEKVADVQLASFLNQLKMTRNHLQELAITIGKEMAPSILALSKNIEGVVQWILKMQRENQGLTTAITAVVGVIKIFALGLAVVWTVLRNVASIIADHLVTSQMNLHTSVSGLVQIYAIWVKAIYQGTIPALNDLGKTAIAVGKLLVAVVARDVVGIAKASKEVIDRVNDAMDNSVGIFRKAVKDSVKVTEETLKTLASTTIDMGKGTVEELKQQWEDLIAFGDKLFPAIEQNTQSSVEAVKEVGNTVTDTTNIINKATEALENNTSAGTGKIKELLDSAKLMELLSQQGLGSIDDKTRMMKPGSFEDDMVRYQNQTRNIGDQSGLNDPFTSQIEKYGEQVKQTEAMLKQLQDLHAKDVQLTREAQEKKAAAIDAYNKRLGMLQKAQGILMVQAGQNMFNDLATAAEGFAGRQSTLYKTMFAASKAFAIAESIIKIQQGIANAAALPWPANFAAIASVVSATANIISTISSVTLAIQGRREGGPVMAGVPYKVGEEGEELFIPAQNGTIIPHNDLKGMSSRGNMVVNVNNYTSAEVEVQERNNGEDRIVELTIRQTKKVLASEIADGRGDVARAMENVYGLRRGLQR